MKGILDKSGKGLVGAASLVGGIGHALQVPHKFRFSITFSKVTNAPTDAECVLVLERRDKLECSGVFCPNPSGTVEICETLGMDVTLFNKEGQEGFDQKKVQVAIRVGGRTGRIVSKLHMDFSKYAMVPSGEKELKLKMSAGAVVRAKVTSSLVKSGRQGSGPSSLYSKITTGSGGIGASNGDLADQDDLDDLLDFDPTPGDFDRPPATPGLKSGSLSAGVEPTSPGAPMGPRPVSSQKQGRRPATATTQPEKATDERVPAQTTAEGLTVENARLEATHHRYEREAARLREDIAEAQQRLKAMETNSTSEHEENEQELQRLKNRAMKLKEENQYLEDKCESSKAEINQLRAANEKQKLRLEKKARKVETKLRKLETENNALSETLHGVVDNVKREPNSSMLLKELESARLMLESVNHEKEQLLLQLEDARSHKNRIRRKWLWWV